MNSALLVHALRLGNLENTINQILEKGDALDAEDALVVAVKDNKIEEVRVLAPHFKDMTHCVRLIETAIMFERIDCLKELMKWINPKSDDSLALQCASAFKNQEAFDLLYPVSDPELALTWKIMITIIKKCLQTE